MRFSQLARGLRAYWQDDIDRKVDAALTRTVIATGRATQSGGSSYTAGDGIDIASSVISVDVTDLIDTSYGLTEDTNNIRISLAGTSGLNLTSGLALDDTVAGDGLTIASKVLAVGAGDGIDVASNSVQLDSGVGGAGLDLTTGVLSVNVKEGVEIDADSLRVDEAYAFAWSAGHSFNAGAYFAYLYPDNTEPGSVSTRADDGTLIFDRNTSDADIGGLGVLGSGTGYGTGGLLLHNPDDGWGLIFDTRNMGSLNTEFLSVRTPYLYADADLEIDPTGNVIFPNAQVAKSTTFTDSLIAGITGFKRYQRTIDSKQSLDIAAIKATELHVRFFVADEVRISRGAEAWAASFGIVAERFQIPAQSATVQVQFEDSAGMSGNIFAVGNRLVMKDIDWGTGLVIEQVEFSVTSRDSVDDNDANTQAWTLTRESASGTTSRWVEAGALMIDFGTVGQGWVELSALKSDGGPWIKFKRWSAGTSPLTGTIEDHVQLGSLDGILSYDDDDYGFAAGTDLGAALASFEGVILHHDDGLAIYNAPLEMYSGGYRTYRLDANGTFYVGLATSGTSPEEDNTTATSTLYVDASTGGIRIGKRKDLAADSNTYAHIVLTGATDANPNRLEFRNAAGAEQAYVDSSTGAITAGGGAVTLDSSGILISPGASAATENSVTWNDGSNTIGILSGYVVGAGAYNTLSTGGSGYSGEISLTALNTSAIGVSNLVLDTSKAELWFTGSNAVGVDSTGAYVDGADLRLSDNLNLENNKAITGEDSTSTARSLLYVSTGNDLIIGNGITAGNYVDVATAGSARLRVWDDTIECNEPLLLEGNDTITNSPPAATSAAGWKGSLYGTSYAFGIAASTWAVKTGGWLSVFANDPDNDGSSTAPDSQAFWGVRSNYLYADSAVKVGGPWTDISSFSNSWANDAGKNPAGYRRYGDMVQLRGTIRNGSFTGTATSLAFTLPSGYYNSSQEQLFPAIAKYNTGVDDYGTALVLINTSGQVYVHANGGSTVADEWLTLDGIQFSLS